MVYLRSDLISRIARNIDRSLEAVEEILGTLLDISRLDAGHLVAEMQSIKIATLFDQLRVEFEPLAARNGLELRFVAPPKKGLLYWLGWGKTA